MGISVIGFRAIRMRCCLQASRLLEEILRAFFGTQNCSTPLAVTRLAWGFETDIQMLCSVLGHSTTGDELQRILSSLATCYVWEGDVYEFAKKLKQVSAN